MASPRRRALGRERRSLARSSVAAMKGGEMGNRYRIRVGGELVTVRVIAIEQRLGRSRGKWVCLNEQTGRRVWRTDRQLRNGERL
jgi:outer membrane protein assembly factor BamB